MSNIFQKMKLSKYGDNVKIIAEQTDPEKLTTGIYALNAIMSGNVYWASHADSIICLAGESNSGKSYVLSKYIACAINDEYDVMLFDSERCAKQDYYRNNKCDTTKLLRIPVGSTMEMRNKAYEIINDYYNCGGKKLLVAIDSLSNLASDKELDDTKEGKIAQDQGSGAKATSSAFRVLASLATTYGHPMIFTNHVYENPAQFIKTRATIAGANKIIYNANQILFFERLVNKEDVEDVFGKIKKQQVGIRIKVTCTKNRLYPEEQTVYLDLRYDTGINPYSGLLQFAIRAGVLENKPKGFLVTETGKTVYEKNLYTEEIFNDNALSKINDWLGKNGYSSLSEIFADEVAQKLGEINGETQD